MKTSLIYLFATFSILFSESSRASERRIYTNIDPPFAYKFYIDESAAEKFSDSVAYKPEFTVSANQAIKEVNSYLITKFPSGYNFKVFECTLGWTGVIEKEKDYLGFQFVFVRSEIVIRKDGPDEIIPCYNLVLPDKTVIEARMEPIK